MLILYQPIYTMLYLFYLGPEGGTEMRSKMSTKISFFLFLESFWVGPTCGKCTWHMDMAQLLVLRLDLMEAREAVLWKIVKAYSERGETFSLSTWRLLFDSMYWSH